MGREPVRTGSGASTVAGRDVPRSGLVRLMGGSHGGYVMLGAHGPGVDGDFVA